MEKSEHFLKGILKFWLKLDRIGSILLLLFLAGFVISFIGFPKQVTETLDGSIFTEKGEVIPCTVTLEGEVTNYIFREGKYAMEDHLRVTVDGKFLANVRYGIGNDFYVFSDSRTVDLILRLSRDLLLAEFDIQTLFPEMESCRAILAVPAEGLDQIGELLEDPNLSETRAEPFLWILE